MRPFHVLCTTYHEFLCKRVPCPVQILCIMHRFTGILIKLANVKSSNYEYSQRITSHLLMKMMLTLAHWLQFCQQCVVLCVCFCEERAASDVVPSSLPSAGYVVAVRLV